MAMNKTTVKKSKKEEQKKLMVRIVCMVLAVALIVTSLITMLGTGTSTEYTLDDLINAGIVYLAEDGNYYFTEEYLASEESHEGHNHD